MLLGFGLPSNRGSKKSKKTGNSLKAITTQEVQSILNAYYEMYTHCQEIFKNHRWNCPIPQRIKDTKNPISFTAVYPLATKEVSYIYSLAAASIVHHIINGCLMGMGKNCPCRSRGKDTGEVIHCQQNFDYGFKRGKRMIKIFDYKFVENKNRRLFNWRNSLIGIQLYKEKLPMVCRCHGISGHCAVKSCWKTTPVSLQEISLKLKKMYKEAKKLNLNHTSLSQHDAIIIDVSKLKDKKVRRTRQNNIIDGLKFIDESPNYCKKNLKLGILGTLHRECDHYNKSSCSNLCDKCGYRKHSYLRNVENKKCKCKFHWCCKVTCSTCTERKVFARCELPFVK